MRQKKRYVLLKTLPQELPSNVKFLFQNEAGFVVKTDPKTSESLRNQALLISGCITNLKQPKMLNRRKKKKSVG